MRRTLLLALVAGAVLASAATAATRFGTARAETLRGTARADYVDPRGGRDTVVAGNGADRITSTDGAVDAVSCGGGFDVVAADLGDRLSNCEVVTRRLALDRLSNPDSVHATIVEPDSYAWGSTMVFTYQVGRRPRPAGAAGAIGFSTTTDGGNRWRSGLRPTRTRNNGGRWDTASDPVVGYDAAHGVWLASSLVVSSSESGLTFHLSPDGVAWSDPVVATRSASRELGVDKQWFACDNTATSPYYGRCYLAYTDLRANGRISLQTSSDGGRTWSAPIGSPDAAGTRNQESSPGVQPVVRPNGELLILFLEDDRMSVIRSTDGGGTLSRTQAVAPVSPSTTPRFRAFSLPSADVGPDGTAYLAWADCGGRARCNGSDLMLSRSADGVSWTQPTAIPAAAAPGVYQTLPGIAAHPSRPGLLALTYYRLLPNGAIDAYSARSSNAGRTWTRSVRLTPFSMRREWMPDTQYGPMVGDYLSTSFLNGAPWGTVVIASPPRNGRLDESIYATRLP